MRTLFVIMFFMISFSVSAQDRNLSRAYRAFYDNDFDSFEKSIQRFENNRSKQLERAKDLDFVDEMLYAYINIKRADLSDIKELETAKIEIYNVAKDYKKIYDENDKGGSTLAKLCKDNIVCPDSIGNTVQFIETQVFNYYVKSNNYQLVESYTNRNDVGDEGKRLAREAMQLLYVDSLISINNLEVLKREMNGRFAEMKLNKPNRFRILEHYEKLYSDNVHNINNVDLTKEYLLEFSIRSNFGNVNASNREKVLHLLIERWYQEIMKRPTIIECHEYLSFFNHTKYDVDVKRVLLKILPDFIDKHSLDDIKLVIKHIVPEGYSLSNGNEYSFLYEDVDGDNKKDLVIELQSNKNKKSLLILTSINLENGKNPKNLIIDDLDGGESFSLYSNEKEFAVNWSKEDGFYHGLTFKKGAPEMELKYYSLDGGGAVGIMLLYDLENQKFIKTNNYTGEEETNKLDLKSVSLFDIHSDIIDEIKNSVGTITMKLMYNHYGAGDFIYLIFEDVENGERIDLGATLDEHNLNIPIINKNNSVDAWEWETNSKYEGKVFELKLVPTKVPEYDFDYNEIGTLDAFVIKYMKLVE